MDNIRKYLSVAGAAVIGFGILLLAKSAGGHHHSKLCENAGKGIDNRLKESVAALESAATRVQSIFEQVKNHKS